MLHKLDESGYLALDIANGWLVGRLIFPYCSQLWLFWTLGNAIALALTSAIEVAYKSKCECQRNGLYLPVPVLIYGRGHWSTPLAKMTGSTTVVSLILQA